MVDECLFADFPNLFHPFLTDYSHSLACEWERPLFLKAPKTFRNVKIFTYNTLFSCSSQKLSYIRHSAPVCQREPDADGQRIHGVHFAGVRVKIVLKKGTRNNLLDWEQLPHVRQFSCGLKHGCPQFLDSAIFTLTSRPRVVHGEHFSHHMLLINLSLQIWEDFHGNFPWTKTFIRMGAGKKHWWEIRWKVLWIRTWQFWMTAVAVNRWQPPMNVIQVGHLGLVLDRTFKHVAPHQRHCSVLELLTQVMGQDIDRNSWQKQPMSGVEDGLASKIPQDKINVIVRLLRFLLVEN